MDKSNIELKPDGEWSEPIALTVIGAAGLSSISRSTLYDALKTGDLVGKKVGRRTIILVKDLKKYLEQLPAFGREEG